MSEVPVIERDAVFDMLRSEREAGPDVNGTFFAGVAGQGVTVAPCVEPPETTAFLLRTVFRAKNEDVLWIAVGLDSYRWTDTEAPGDEDTDFAAMFLAGDPRISESLIAAACDKDGPVWIAEQTYAAVGEHIVWGDIEDCESEWLPRRLMAIFP